MALPGSSLYNVGQQTMSNAASSVGSGGSSGGGGFVPAPVQAPLVSVSRPGTGLGGAAAAAAQATAGRGGPVTRVPGYTGAPLVSSSPSVRAPVMPMMDFSDALSKPTYGPYRLGGVETTPQSVELPMTKSGKPVLYSAATGPELEASNRYLSEVLADVEATVQARWQIDPNYVPDWQAELNTALGDTAVVDVPTAANKTLLSEANLESMSDVPVKDVLAVFDQHKVTTAKPEFYSSLKELNANAGKLESALADATKQFGPKTEFSLDINQQYIADATNVAKLAEMSTEQRDNLNKAVVKQTSEVRQTLEDINKRVALASSARTENAAQLSALSAKLTTLSDPLKASDLPGLETLRDRAVKADTEWKEALADPKISETDLLVKKNNAELATKQFQDQMNATATKETPDLLGMRTTSAFGNKTTYNTGQIFTALGTGVAIFSLWNQIERDKRDNERQWAIFNAQQAEAQAERDQRHEEFMLSYGLEEQQVANQTAALENKPVPTAAPAAQPSVSLSPVGVG